MCSSSKHHFSVYLLVLIIKLTNSCDLLCHFTYECNSEFSQNSIRSRRWVGSSKRLMPWQRRIFSGFSSSFSGKRFASSATTFSEKNGGDQIWSCSVWAFKSVSASISWVSNGLGSIGLIWAILSVTSEAVRRRFSSDCFGDTEWGRFSTELWDGDE